MGWNEQCSRLKGAGGAEFGLRAATTADAASAASPQAFSGRSSGPLECPAEREPVVRGARERFLSAWRQTRASGMKTLAFPALICVGSCSKCQVQLATRHRFETPPARVSSMRRFGLLVGSAPPLQAWHCRARRCAGAEASEAVPTHHQRLNLSAPSSSPSARQPKTSSRRPRATRGQRETGRSTRSSWRRWRFSWGRSC